MELYVELAMVPVDASSRPGFLGDYLDERTVMVLWDKEDIAKRRI